MKLILLLLSLLITSMGLSETLPPNYYNISSEKNKLLKSNESIIKISFPEVQDKSYTIQFSIDGKDSSSLLHKGDFIKFETTPGVHHFEFYYDHRYIEIFATLEVKSRFEDHWGMLFRAPSPEQRIHEIQVEKPVIYLYPEQKMKVSVNVKPVGDFIFTYPEIKNGWELTADIDGTLDLNGKKYNYLFWETKQKQILKQSNEIKGFVIEGKNIVSFLEDKLSLAGLNPKEQADFITYWGPKIISSETIFIHFEFNEECERYAALDISPKPDNLYRIFMTWKKVDPRFRHTVEPQNIKSTDRKGFTVIEWGGSMLPNTELYSETTH